VNTVMNFRIPYNLGTFLSNCVTDSTQEGLISIELAMKYSDFFIRPLRLRFKDHNHWMRSLN
jgi:hypothetical protein